MRGHPWDSLQNIGVSPLTSFDLVEESSFDYFQNAQTSKDKKTNGHQIYES